MAPVTVLDRPDGHAPFQLPPDFARYDSDSDASASASDAADMQKDATEEELERLVFGDRAGFREGIQNFGRRGELVVADGEQEEEDSDLDNVADADLFFTDSGPNANTGKALVPAPGADDSDDDFADAGRDAPAWEDSDDERMVVSLASVPRLRKLRKTEDEDLINGKEYARRLRRQFERLYPTPDWAVPAARRPSKRRKISEHDRSSADEDESSNEDMDIDEVDLSAQPLAKLLKDADSLTRRATTGPAKRRKLRPEVLDIQRTKDISGMQPSAITSLSFHPTLPILLSSGPSSTLYLHHVQPIPPNPNPLLTSLHIKRTPLTTTAFHPSPDDSRIFLSARRRYFHVWNLTTGTIEKVTRVYGHQQEQRTMERFALSPNGKYMALLGSARKGGGYINILDARTLQWQSQARIESLGGIADFAWWADGNGLTIAGKNGEISEWDAVAQRLRARWVDEGAVGTSVIALGGRSGRDDWLGGDRWVVVGSSSGIVNVYDRRAWLPANNNNNNNNNNGGVPAAPKPVKVLDQLTTPISHLRLSPDGQLLAMASRWKKDALRLVHLPSCTVYRNWPTGATPLGRITAVAFGDAAAVEEKDGKGVDAELMLAVANEQGKIRLWEIRA
ncbi:wd40 repeat-like protein [Diplodia corticola]|uniref:Wd40 repeat-like protein n=1 Tax=Diplodia corticola TaxID=236234 RepID=A0A1J9R949_9PEZI|nr:wd40 repeat-like protein [Diplodia corticola]OJD37080.1 wd40 repeat-like protein [Diplodia corticola]